LPDQRLAEVRPVFRFIVALGAAGLVILGVGLLQFINFEPPGQHTGVQARILGFWDYDQKTGAITGDPKDHFKTTERLAAEVDWAALPPDLLVGGHWFLGGFALDAGGVGPARAGDFGPKPAVPLQPPSDRGTPPGRYTFVVERYSGLKPVEVLARASVLVIGGR